MILRVLLFAGISLNFAFIGQAAEYWGLVVKGDYKKLPVFFHLDQLDDENAWALTEADIEKAVKLRLLNNGIKALSLPDDTSLWMHYLLVRVSTIRECFIMQVELRKMTKVYAENAPFLGASVRPLQGKYGHVGYNSTLNKSFIIDTLSEVVDEFLLDYLESNITYLEGMQKLREYQKELHEGIKTLEKSGK